MKLVSARCPNCNADIQLDSKFEQAKCEFCNSQIYVENAIGKQEAEMTLKIENFKSADKLEKNAKKFIEFKDFTKAQEIYEELSNNYPEKASGWWGLIVCITNNFTINPRFVSTKKYYQRFLQTADEKEREELVPVYEKYIGAIRDEINTIKDKNDTLKEYKIAVFYCIITILYGYIGFHKFFKKQWFMGFLYLFTFGLFFVGWFYDSYKSVKEVFIKYKNYKNTLN